jgi:acetyl-CoA carboxylase biotin carboxylase subunit
LKKIKKILIANRGEIAVRIHRSAQEMGIETVAIFSDPDRTAPHVLLCNQAFPLHGITSSETYLNIEKVLDIARKANVDAIHPGYGFLSEREQFAQAVINAGLIFIGPRPETIGLLGNKTSARELLANHNVPIVPGTTSPIKNVDDVLNVVKNIGFPILIKAAGGGGGKGMRRVDGESDLKNAIERARNESQKAFNDDRLYIEKFIANPKHIEIQVFADAHGNIIHLGERECSVQRRHQKVVEECPSPVMTEELRKKMGETAVSIAKASGYVNAGTVEFLLDDQKNFYFLEVNTRIQVEHPVTEMVYGIDIVKEQIRIAEGEKLSLIQNDIRMNGHAIECRISAEETDNDFLPSTGKITHFYPSEGPGIRHDSGARIGSEITMHYDPMIAKLIVHGRNRKEAIAKMSRALSEYKINGIKTTIPFCQFVMQHDEFINGTYTIDFVEKNFRPSTVSLHHNTAAAIASAYSTHSVNNNSAANTHSAERKLSKWKASFFDE